MPPPPTSPKRDFPDVLPPAGKLERLNHGSAYPDKGKPVTIRDIVVFGPILMSGNKRYWSMGMQGYRWSTVMNDPEAKNEIDADDADAFVKEYITKFRDEAAFSKGESAFDDRRTFMDIDVIAPTLIVVVSPTPNLVFDEEFPITSKLDYRPDASDKFGSIDPKCIDHNPRLWSYTDDNWKETGAHVLTWFSEYDDGIVPPGQDGTLRSHNYHMKFTGNAYGTNGEMYVERGILPIIFDPGNNNGGAGGPTKP